MGLEEVGGKGVEKRKRQTRTHRQRQTTTTTANENVSLLSFPLSCRGCNIIENEELSRCHLFLYLSLSQAVPCGKNEGKNNKKGRIKAHHADAEAGAATASLAGEDSAGHRGGALLAEAGRGAWPQGCGSSESLGISP